MKTFLLAFLFLFLSFSQISKAGYVAESKINECNVTDYTSQGSCQEKEGEACFDRGNSGECGVYKLVDTYGGARKSVDECEGEQDCKAKLADKSCLDSQAAFIDADYSFTYCMDKVGKEAQVDQAALSQKQSSRAQLEQKEAAIQKALAAIDCGKRVKAVMIVQNSSKNLTTAQVGQMVATNAQVAALLDTGSLTTARGVISNIPADGVLVTEEDRSALIDELDKCKPQ